MASLKDTQPALTAGDQPLLGELPTFELFFKTFGFKRLHGRVWGLLVLSPRALSSKEISCQERTPARRNSPDPNNVLKEGRVPILESPRSSITS